ncbi:MAG: protoporphyrinogen oxidase HemJ [Rickettsiales bacterium]|jgi:putative membrane protein|nr:protoporphyrinogen oxidase HemJ [Rickettsiales bacterium]
MLDSLYLWVKAFHIIAVLSWMAGMLYLPRLFVYHSQVAVGSEASELFKAMERKLMRFIINPAMIAAWIFGVWLIIITKAGAPGMGYWMHAKIALLIGMQIAHAMMSRYRKAFFRDERPKSERYFRWFNEVPTVLMIGIVFLVVLKPL